MNVSDSACCAKQECQVSLSMNPYGPSPQSEVEQWMLGRRYRWSLVAHLMIVEIECAGIEPLRVAEPIMVVMSMEDCQKQRGPGIFG
jgi:hypothetical protein